MIAAPASAQISIAATETALTENFDSLVNSGTTPSGVVPSGWSLLEVGSSATTVDQMYVPGTGSLATGNLYSFGATGSTERALGILRSGTNNPTIGASYANATGAPITSATISFTGEEWRVGALNRDATLTFEYSVDATSLSTGVWLPVSALNFSRPDTAGAAMSAEDGNSSAFRDAHSGTVSFASPIAAGATFWIRWSDQATSGTHSGLAIDDFSLTAHALVVTPTGTVAFDVFFDANANGTHDTGETGIGGWGITLDAATSHSTAADGSATFTSVTSGTAHVVTNMPPTAAGTWNATAFPTTVTTTTGGTTTYHVAITCTCPDDADLCTNIPVCNAGACGVPTQINCNDTNGCTDDSCAAGVCMHTNNTATCDDGNMSTRNDVCGGGSCAGTPFTCTLGVCELMSMPNGTDCTIVYADSSMPCGASGSCDHCAGGASMCVANACPVDSGVDAGSDAGTDAGNDAGSDAGMDAAVTNDAGVDAAAGSDAGVDAASGTDTGVVVDAGTHDAGARDGGPDSGRDGSVGDGSVRADSGTTTPPPSMNCGCSTSGRGTPSMLWLGLVGLVLAARKRQR